MAACPGARSSCSLRQGRARHSSASPDRCRYQSRPRRGPGISGKMFSAPGVLARVERSGGRVRGRPKRSCCPWTPTAARRTLPGIGSGVPPVHAVVPCRVICDWRSWPAGGRGCRGSQDQAASEWPRRPRTAPPPPEGRPTMSGLVAIDLDCRRSRRLQDDPFRTLVDHVDPLRQLSPVAGEPPLRV